MTKEELLKRLTDIEWDDFEVKEAKSELPKNVWETVCAFANTSGGWIVLGVKQNGKQFEATGVTNPEKMEQDFIGTVRSHTKLNVPIPVKAERHNLDGRTILAFYIPSSAIKPVYLNNNLSNTFIRTGSGDQHATDMEIQAIQRDQAFGSRSELSVEGTSLADLSPQSISTYRRRIVMVNEEFAYNNLNDEDFCTKIGVLRNGNLTYGGLLMLGRLDSIHRYVSNFWIDYLEIPGTSYSDATERYTYRMVEQENIWEYYQTLIQRLRLYTDNPFTTGPDGFSPDDNSQLYCIREGLVNMLAHADYFSPMHSTIRVFADRIEFMNPGRFIMDLQLLRQTNSSAPRNPNIIKFFRYAKLSENVGYGIDKILRWKKLTGKDVKFQSELLMSIVTYPRQEKNADIDTIGTTEKTSTKTSTKTDEILSVINVTPDVTIEQLMDYCGLKKSGVRYHLEKLKAEGVIIRVGGNKGGYWHINKSNESK